MSEAEKARLPAYPADRILELAVRLGFQRNGRPGMADYQLTYKPYDASWEARVSWDNAAQELATGMSAAAAEAALEQLLNRKLKEKA